MEVGCQRGEGVFMGHRDMFYLCWKSLLQGLSSSPYGEIIGETVNYNCFLLHENWALLGISIMLTTTVRHLRTWSCFTILDWGHSYGCVVHYVVGVFCLCGNLKPCGQNLGNWKHCIARGINCLTVYLAPQTEIFRGNWTSRLKVQTKEITHGLGFLKANITCFILLSTWTFLIKIIQTGDLLRWDRNKTLSISDWSRAELGLNTIFTLHPPTATSEIESIAVATDWFAAIMIMEPAGPSLSNIEP